MFQNKNRIIYYTCNCLSNYLLKIDFYEEIICIYHKLNIMSGLESFIIIFYYSNHNNVFYIDK